MKKIKINNKVIKSILEWVYVIAIAFAVYWLISQFLIFAQISGSSMIPTVEDGDYVIAVRRLYELETDDVIAFEYTENGMSEYHIKRVIGLPGDQVKVEDNKVYVNDQLQIEGNYVGYEEGVYNLEEDEYFVVGDNYDNSYDSRSHGPINEEDIIGEVKIKLPF